ncbi:uncharacterized protein LOC113932563 [Zalophus californianus]|uniref:Uncharacterized protein LOC113932563 n=1 Tax=Zalophus californianus TaxID=9704 RepID=A0A6J2EHC7_ZALCA|nr:uncharacterized protein LOC113932563 [Zalophus californianus]
MSPHASERRGTPGRDSIRGSPGPHVVHVLLGQADLGRAGDDLKGLDVLGATFTVSGPRESPARLRLPQWPGSRIWEREWAGSPARHWRGCETPEARSWRGRETSKARIRQWEWDGSRSPARLWRGRKTKEARIQEWEWAGRWRLPGSRSPTRSCNSKWLQTRLWRGYEASEARIQERQQVGSPARPSDPERIWSRLWGGHEAPEARPCGSRGLRTRHWPWHRARRKPWNFLSEESCRGVFYYVNEFTGMGWEPEPSQARGPSQPWEGA